MTPEDFDTLFDTFQHTAYRLETRRAYDVGDIGDEAERIRAIRTPGMVVPERSITTDPWMARIALTTLTQHKTWRRVRVVDEPLTDYQRIELVALVEAQVAGDRNRIITRTAAATAGDVPEAWLFDIGTPRRRAVVMHYDNADHWLGFEEVEDDSELDALEVIWHAVHYLADELNVFLARYGHEQARLARA